MRDIVLASVGSVSAAVYLGAMFCVDDWSTLNMSIVIGIITATGWAWWLALAVRRHAPEEP